MRCFSAIALSCLLISPLMADSWSSPTELSQPRANAVGVQVAIDASENCVALWSRYDGQHYVLQSATSTFGGSWSKQTNLSHPKSDAFFGKVTIDSQGNAIAVWSAKDKNNFVIQSSFKSPKSTWRNVVNLSQTDSSKQNATAPQIATDKYGNITVVWQSNNGISNVIQAATSAMGKNWSQPVNLSRSESIGLGNVDPQLAINPRGDTVAVWTNNTTSTIEASVKPFGKRWSQPIALSGFDQLVCNPQVTIDAQGNAIATWSRHDGFNYIVQAVQLTAKGECGTPVDLSSPGGNALTPQIAIDRANHAIVVWHRHDGTNTIVQAATQQTGNEWTAPVDLSDYGQDASEPKIVVGQTGTVVVCWQKSDGENFIVQSTSKFVNGLWSTPISLSMPGQDAISPQIALDRLDHAIAGWSRSNGTNTITQISFGTIE